MKWKKRRRDSRYKGVISYLLLVNRKKRERLAAAPFFLTNRESWFSSKENYQSADLLKEPSYFYI